ncbi:MAG TPA: hypothetical protein VKR52_03285 [Terracidiphilus sp.]|nr:hypothetical protein [Terracidiphilus sp.]
MRPPARSLELTQVTEWNEGAVHPQQDWLAAEEPLEIRVNGTPRTVTMRTYGAGLVLNGHYHLYESERLRVEFQAGTARSRTARRRAFHGPGVGSCHGPVNGGGN